MILFIGLALCSGLFWTVIPPNQRRNFLLVLSVALAYLMQPMLDIPGLNLVLPTLSIVMVIGVWLLVVYAAEDQPAPPDTGAATTPPTPPGSRLSPQLRVPLLLLMAGAVLFIAAPQQGNLTSLLSDMVAHGLQGHSSLLLPAGALLTVGVLALPRPQQPIRYVLLIVVALVLLILFGSDATKTASNARLLVETLLAVPKGAIGILLLALAALSLFPAAALRARPTARRRLALIWLLLMAALLVLIKVPQLAMLTSARLRADNLQNSAGVAADLSWLGFSYIVFRLAHVLTDFRDKSLKARPGLADFATYVLFFPSIVAGPITRVEQVTPQLKSNLAAFKMDYLGVGTLRLTVGLFKKFVIADQLATVATNARLLDNLNDTGALWVLLYISLIHLYFDFSGYSDIAIGLGHLFGITLPENFDRPFAQPNLSLFWQSWHITLSAWFRYYWFNPLTRRMMKTSLRRHTNVVVFISQVSTMALVGLWHGATLNWLAWGVWHGLGLFAYKVLGDWNRARYRQWTSHPFAARALYFVNVFLTSHYMLLSMVFIAAPDFSQSVRFLLALFGLHI